MSFVKEIPPARSEGLLKEVYQRITEQSGNIANIWKVNSLFPEMMALQWSLYRLVTFGESTLSNLRREMIALVVSVANHCDYSIQHHQSLLRTLVRDEDFVSQLLLDIDQVKIEDGDRAMLAYAVKLTKQPSQVNQADVEKLKLAGFTDREIIEIAHLSGYYNFSNRIVNGLGVQPES